jgi:thiol:disulfide interchange protein
MKFSDESVDVVHGQGKTAFVDFTASWCITCKTNELVVIDTDETAAKLKSLDITPMRADWTSGDEVITAALKRYGAEGVPLYVVLPPGGRSPIVLSGIISKTSLYKAFEQAAGKI